MTEKKLKSYPLARLVCPGCRCVKCGHQMKYSDKIQLLLKVRYDLARIPK